MLYLRIPQQVASRMSSWPPTCQDHTLWKWPEKDVKHVNTEIKSTPPFPSFLPAIFVFCSTVSEIPPIPSGHYHLSGKECVRAANETAMQLFCTQMHIFFKNNLQNWGWLGQFCAVSHKDTSIRLTIVLHDSMLKPSVFRSLSGTTKLWF